MSALFTPLRLGSRRAANRLAVAPMTTTQSNADGSVSTDERQWLERLGADGYGLVISCAAAISRNSIAFQNQLSLGDDSFVPGLQRLAAAVKAHGSLAVVQLCHGGSRALATLTGVEPHSASAYELPVAGFVKPKALSGEQVERIVEDFAQACARAAAAGFDGVEFHGANGYLFTQFISTMTNHRTDAWGGSLANRARFAREVVRACRKRVPEGFILGFRLSFENAGLETGLDLDENVQVLRWLAEDGIDYGHVSQLNLMARSVKHANAIAFELIRQQVDRALPLIAAGGVMSRANAEQALALGADVVAIGRAAIGNTNVPARFARDERLVDTPYDQGRLATLGVSAAFRRYLTTAPPLASLNIVRTVG